MNSTGKIYQFETPNKYFPFVDGENLEERRKQIHQEFKDSIHRIENKMYATVDHRRRSRLRAYSQANNYGAIAKVTPGAVRTLFDSCYLRPSENPRVIQDTDPAKAEVLSSAHSRQR
jgi:hypothetical protein